jgi:multiple sugar transport system ATP-binding protein
MPFGDAPLTAHVRQRLQASNGGHCVPRRDRRHPSRALRGRGDRGPGAPDRIRFRAKVDVVESMGSELYAYFSVKSEGGGLQSAELAELAKDAGMEDLPSAAAATRSRSSLASTRRAPHGPSSPLEFSLNAAEIMLFDPKGGNSLTRRVAARRPSRAAYRGASPGAPAGPAPRPRGEPAGRIPGRRASEARASQRR